MKVIFMGCADFGLPTLRSLHKSFNVTGVFTSVPKPKGRGYHEQKNNVHLLSEELGIRVVPVKSMKEPHVLQALHDIEADIIVVVAYGFILRKEVLESKKYGCINLHPSDLPNFRGAAPLQYTILARCNTTKVCVIQMDSGIDTGDILISEKIDIAPSTTYIQLHDQCANLGANLICNVIENIDNIKPTAQIGEGTYASKISREDGLLNPQDTTKTIMGKCLAFNPWPSLYFYYQDKRIKILSMIEEKDEECDGVSMEYKNTQAINYKPSHSSIVPGDFVISNTTFKIRVIDGYINITLVQPEGKKIMTTKDWLNGFINRA